MKRIKDELQDIIFRNEQAGKQSELQKVQRFLRRYAQTGERAEKQQYLKSEEAAAILSLAAGENLIYLPSLTFIKGNTISYKLINTNPLLLVIVITGPTLSLNLALSA